ncbi:hypothetical protein NUW54_g3693 [Trametes sanguinea]|uniref:Uncharacterized protein n=1 Tax=Trametes sanguinea TaxID=158606 RepID=A0ACC1Q1P5_9APHY|nr:hypothetical protein NUW54_g3693 [Trametes sanguinea]
MSSAYQSVQPRRPVFCPSPGAYAVIRLNPVEMVKHLGDAEALEQAKALTPRFHLIYLSLDMALPFPGRPWYRFRVSPIAPKLRKEDPKRGITPAMCIPIYPNTVHPNGRPPLRPQGVFPFSNCYHWIENTSQVRVRARPEGFDETNLVRLSYDSMSDMAEIWAEDVMAAVSAEEAAEAANFTDAVDDGLHAQGDAHGHTAEIDGYFSSHPPQAPAETQADDVDRTSIASASSASDDEFADDLEHLATMDIFSGPECDVDLEPLVDLWISELSEHLKEEDIPDPEDLFAECEQIAQIIRDARIRRSCAKMAASVATSSTKVDDEKAVLVRKHQRLRPAKLWTKLRLITKHTSRRFSGYDLPCDYAAYICHGTGTRPLSTECLRLDSLPIHLSASRSLPSFCTEWSNGVLSTSPAQFSALWAIREGLTEMAPVRAFTTYERCDHGSLAVSAGRKQ